MMKYLTKALCLGMIAISVSSLQVNALSASSNDSLVLNRVQKHIEKTVKREGIENVIGLYEQIVSFREKPASPVVRQFMGQLQHWLEDAYQEQGNWRQIAKRASVRGGAYLKPEVQVTHVVKPRPITQEQENVALASIEDDTETPVYVSPFTPQPKKQTTRKTAVAPSTDFQRYQLAEGYIDLERVQETWLDRVNDLRQDRDLPNYSFDNRLHKTAALWSSVMKKKQSADHKRFSRSSYYDYPQVEQWFADAGVVFTNDNRSTFTENVGYSYFNCTEGDCTESAIISLRAVFEYFISEEGKAYDVHRRTLIHPKYKVMGMGIAVDEDTHFIYSAMHYGTEIVE